MDGALEVKKENMDIERVFLNFGNSYLKLTLVFLQL